jgi:hypothetical protein
MQRSWSIATHLIGLAIVCTLPIALVAGGLSYGPTQRRHSECGHEIASPPALPVRFGCDATAPRTREISVAPVLYRVQRHDSPTQGTNRPVSAPKVWALDRQAIRRWVPTVAPAPQ